MKIKVAHLTSVHGRHDIRITLKECSSLARAGYAVSLVVADGKGFEVKNGVNIYDVGLIENRFSRIVNTTKNVYMKAIELDADIYHFHDPEMIPTGLKLKKAGKTVIFDSHEDFAGDLLTKDYIPILLRQIILVVFRLYDTWACKKFDTIVTATPAISKLYSDRGCKTVVINNFPIIEELSVPKVLKENIACFMGTQNRIRGIKELVQAIGKTDGMLYLAGCIDSEEFKNELQSIPSWEKVVDLGVLSRSDVADVLAKSSVGLVTYLPAPNHIDAQPNKLFEYMSVGLPVIASDFPLWQEIVVDNDCGLCVDPANPEEIAKAIQFFFDNPDERLRMGENGMKAVNDTYNWHVEEKKLIDLYARMSENG
jgi:glycosyltransferase involved in cell wall biosynthesis